MCNLVITDHVCCGCKKSHGSSHTTVQQFPCQQVLNTGGALGSCGKTVRTPRTQEVDLCSDCKADVQKNDGFGGSYGW